MTSCLSRVDQRSISLAFLTNNSASADDEHLEADANSKHHNAEAGKRAAKLLKVALIKASCS